MIWCFANFAFYAEHVPSDSTVFAEAISGLSFSCWVEFYSDYMYSDYSAMRCSGEYGNHITISHIVARMSKFHKPFLSEKIHHLEAERGILNILLKICVLSYIIVTHDY